MQTINDKTMLIDQDCTITHEGVNYTHGGGFILRNKITGLYEGVMYGDWDHNVITNWDGSVKLSATYYGHHRGNMGDKRCYVRFTWQGMRFYGRWCGMDWSQIVRVKQLKGS